VVPVAVVASDRGSKSAANGASAIVTDITVGANR
jgi:hypothetical protein